MCLRRINMHHQLRLYVVKISQNLSVAFGFLISYCQICQLMYLLIHLDSRGDLIKALMQGLQDGEAQVPILQSSLTTSAWKTKTERTQKTQKQSI